MRRASRPIPFQCASLWLTVLLMAMPSLAAPEPCSLLTTAEVEQVVGKLKGVPKADNEGAASWCNYEFTNGKDLMEVWVFPAEAIERGRKVSKKPVVIKGLGDAGVHGPWDAWDQLREPLRQEGRHDRQTVDPGDSW